MSSLLTDTAAIVAQFARGQCPPPPHPPSPSLAAACLVVERHEERLHPRVHIHPRVRLPRVHDALHDLRLRLAQRVLPGVLLLRSRGAPPPARVRFTSPQARALLKRKQKHPKKQMELYSFFAFRTAACVLGSLFREGWLFCYSTGADVAIRKHWQQGPRPALPEVT